MDDKTIQDILNLDSRYAGNDYKTALSFYGVPHNIIDSAWKYLSSFINYESKDLFDISQLDFPYARSDEEAGKIILRGKRIKEIRPLLVRQVNRVAVSAILAQTSRMTLVKETGIDEAPARLEFLSKGDLKSLIKAKQFSSSSTISLQLNKGKLVALAGYLNRRINENENQIKEINGILDKEHKKKGTMNRGDFIKTQVNKAMEDLSLPAGTLLRRNNLPPQQTTVTPEETPKEKPLTSRELFLKGLIDRGSQSRDSR